VERKSKQYSKKYSKKCPKMTPFARVAILALKLYLINVGNNLDIYILKACKVNRRWKSGERIQKKPK
jgi:hypothetical protein